MYRAGDTIVYGNSGVCRVQEVKKADLGMGEQTYYVLRTLSEKGSGTIFVPRDNAALCARMHPLLTADEFKSIVRAAQPFSGDAWPPDSRTRIKRLKELLSSGDRLLLIRLVKTLVAARRRGEKHTAADDAALQHAADMLYEEAALLFDLRPGDMIAFLTAE